MLHKIIIAAVVAVQMLNTSIGISRNGANIAENSVNENTVSENSDDIKYTAIPFKFASKAECIDFFKNNTDYYNNLNQMNIDWRMGKNGATLEEYQKYAYEQAEDFTDEETLYYKERLANVQAKLNALGYDYTINKPIIFFKTTMHEEMDAAAYTFENCIFMGDDFYEYYLKYSENGEAHLIDKYLEEVLTHEIFHVLTRNDPDFRAKMYKAIGFEIGEAPAFSDEVKAQIVSNPDVKNYDCYAYFTLNGTKKKGTIVSYYDMPFKAGEKPFAHIASGIVFYDEPDKIYPAEDIVDFYDVVGRNTDYVIAAEECMADNFAFAVNQGMDGDYKDPQIIEYIIKNIK